MAKKPENIIKEEPSESSSENNVPQEIVSAPTDAASTEPIIPLVIDEGIPMMPVPDIEKISPLLEEPRIPVHAAGGAQQTNSPPIIEGQQRDEIIDAPVSEPGMAPAAEGQPQQLPPPNPETFSQEPQAIIQPTAAEASRADAEATFQQFVSMYNYNIENQLPLITDVKAPTKELFALKQINPDSANGITTSIEKWNKANVENIMLSEGEIKQLHDPAVQVLQDTNTVFTAKDMLFLQLAQIGGNKIKHIIRMAMTRKAVKADIAAQIQSAIDHSDLNFRASNTMKVEADATLRKAQELYAEMTRMEKERQRIPIPLRETKEPPGPTLSSEVSEKNARVAESILVEINAHDNANAAGA